MRVKLKEIKLKTAFFKTNPFFFVRIKKILYVLTRKGRFIAINENVIIYIKRNFIRKVCFSRASVF